MQRKRIEDTKSAISDLFDLPKDILLNIPKIIIVGNNQMLVENHKGIIEYTPQRIRINSTIGVIRVQGNGMKLRNIAADDIMITGGIKVMEFV